MRARPVVSFDLYVLSAEIPPVTPGELVRLLEDQASLDGDLVPELQEVVDALAAEWPTLDEDLDLSPWASHPLEQSECGGRVLALNIRWPHAESTAPTVRALCSERNLRLFDPQSDAIIFPGAGEPRRGLLRRLIRGS